MRTKLLFLIALNVVIVLALQGALGFEVAFGFDDVDVLGDSWYDGA